MSRSALQTFLLFVNLLSLLSFSGATSNSLSNVRYIGPFSVGKTEIDADPLIAWVDGLQNGCTFETLLRRKAPCPSKFPSELADGGWVTWTTPPQTSTTISLAHSDIAWNKLISGLNKMTVLEFQGWITAELRVSRAGYFKVHFTPVHSFFMDGVLFAGDIYRQETSVVMFLAAGAHFLHMRVRGKANLQIEYSIRYLHSGKDEASSSQQHQAQQASASPWFTIKAPTELTDLVDGALPFNAPAWIQLRTQNALDHWIDDIEPILTPIQLPHGPQARPTVQSAPSDPQRHRFATALAPLHTQLLPLSFTLDHAHTGGASTWARGFYDQPQFERSACLQFSVALRGRLRSQNNRIVTSNSITLSLRCRFPGQSFLFSFPDHDGSITHAGAIAPHQECPEIGCPVLLTLSGVAVSPQSQIDSYKFKARPSDSAYRFGLDAAWVLAPHRSGAHNWEGTGFQTALAVVAFLERVARIDSTRVVIAGHSRGGKGAVLIAAHFPDLFVGVASASGYSDREIYGDANVVFDLDSQLAFMDAQTIALFFSTIAENDAAHSVSNFHNLSVYIRAGGADTTVNPYYQRLLLRLLHTAHVPVVYEERPGVSHWTWDWDAPEDGGICFDPSLRRWITRQLASASLPDVSRYTVTSLNPGAFGTMRGVHIEQLASRLRHGRVVVETVCGVASCTVTMQPFNVQQLRLTATFIQYHRRHGAVDGAVWLRIGDLHVEVQAPVTICAVESPTWRVCDAEMQRPRLPENMGPARQTFAHPFVLVVGTQNASLSAPFLSIARYLSAGHMHASETIAPIVLDVDFPTSLVQDSLACPNVILIGGPDQNSVSDHYTKLLPLFPVRFPQPGTFTIGADAFSGPHTGVAFTFPHAFASATTAESPWTQRHRLNFMIAAADAATAAELVAFSYSSNVPLTRAPFSNMFPDVVVTGPRWRGRGLGGLRAAGYWDNRWRLSDSKVVLDADSYSGQPSSGTGEEETLRDIRDL